MSLRPQRPLHPRTDRGRCSSSTSATDSQGTCTSSNRPMLEATPSTCAAAARPSETNPRRATRVMRCLTTPRELWSSSFTLRRASRGGRRVTGTVRSCGSPIEEPSVRAPGRAALSSAHRESSTSADAFVTTSATPRCASAAGLVLPLDPVKDRGSERSRGAFHRRMPARPDACAPGLERGPATDRRVLPPWTGFRRSFADPTRLSRGSGS